MSKKYYIDTETCGFHGPVVLLQYAIDEGPIILHDVWHTPICDTLTIIEDMCRNTVIGFNLAFDWFHLIQLYTTLIQFEDVSQEPNIYDYAIFESKAIDLNLCLKPTHCFDIMLHARKGPYQSTMDRKDVRIKKVPTALAFVLAEELTRRIPFNDVYFARRSTLEGKKKRWGVRDIKGKDGTVIPDFKDVVLAFAPSSALKALAGDIFNMNTTKYTDVELPHWTKPKEVGWAPYALGPVIEDKKIKFVQLKPGRYTDWLGKWPAVIKYHIEHWYTNEEARRYANDDVKYTRDLYHHFGDPEVDDVDSILSCMVAAVRWRGFRIDIPKMQRLSNQAKTKIEKPPCNFNSPRACVIYLHEVMSETGKIAMLVDGKPSTKSQVLKEIATFELDDLCPDCNGMGCPKCEDGLIKTGIKHPAAIRAQEILDFRKAKKEIENYDKLLAAGRFHASFKVIGTLSGRMAGADNLNPQGINHNKEVRECFPLAWPGYQLSGGDFSGFEVCIAEAAYKDPLLREELLSGKKIHALFGMQLFPPMTYDEIKADKAKYSTSKQCVFAMLYGGDANTLNTRSGIPIEIANEAYQRWLNKYKVWGQERQRYFDMFCSMRQPNGIGTKVEWHEPQPFVESLLGFRRYFTLENTICKALYDLQENPPAAWNDLKIKVMRRDREQTACGAVRSALLCAAFSAQSNNMRAASNHVIQSTGAQMTKILQTRIWTLQPSGISPWVVQPMNIHDEIMCPSKPEVIKKIRRIVNDFVAEYVSLIPLLEIEWNDNMKNWAGKDSADDREEDESPLFVDEGDNEDEGDDECLPEFT